MIIMSGCRVHIPELVREAEKKEVIFLGARPLRGGGDKGLTTKKKELFLKL